MRNVWKIVAVAVAAVGMAAAVAVSPRASGRVGSAIKSSVRQARYRRWVRDLSSESFAKRQGALELLRQAGPGALPVLKHAEQRASSPELISETRNLIHRIELFELVGPTMVRFPDRRVSAAKIMAIMGHAIGGNFVPFKSENGPAPNIKGVRLHLPRETFWHAAATLAAATRSRVDGTYGSGALVLLAARHPPPPASFFGPVMVQCRKIERRSVEMQNTNPALPPHVRYAFRLRFRYFNEPKLLLLTTTEFGLDKIVTSAGPFPLAKLYLTTHSGPGTVWNENYTLPWLPRSGRELRLLKGHINVVAAGAIKRWKISPIMRLAGTKRHIGTVLAAVTRVQATESDYLITVSFRPAASPHPSPKMALSPAETLTLCNLLATRPEVTLRDARRGRFAMVRRVVSPIQGGGDTMQLWFANTINRKPASARTFRMLVPTRRVAFTVPIQFKNLRLP